MKPKVLRHGLCKLLQQSCFGLGKCSNPLLFPETPWASQAWKASSAWWHSSPAGFQVAATTSTDFLHTRALSSSFHKDVFEHGPLIFYVLSLPQDAEENLLEVGVKDLTDMVLSQMLLVHPHHMLGFTRVTCGGELDYIQLVLLQLPHQLWLILRQSRDLPRPSS